MGILVTLILIAAVLVLLVVAYSVHVRQTRERHEETMAAIDALREEIELERTEREALHFSGGSGTGRHHLAETTAQFPSVDPDYRDYPMETQDHC